MLLLAALCAVAWGCDDDGTATIAPIELCIGFPSGASYEFAAGETRRIDFTVEGNDMADLRVAAEAPESWTAVATGVLGSDAYEGRIEVTAPASASEGEVVLNVTDRDGKVWTARIAVSATLSPVTLTIGFPQGTAYEFTAGETKTVAFTVAGNDLTGLQVAAEAPASWTAVATGGLSGDDYAGEIVVTAPGAASQGELTLTVTDRDGKAWTGKVGVVSALPPVELTIVFPDGGAYEFHTGETKNVAFSVTGNDLTGLQVAAEAPASWTAVATGGLSGDDYAGEIVVTAPGAASQGELTLMVTDRDGKAWTGAFSVSAALPPVTATDLSAAGSANSYLVTADGAYMFDASKRGNGSGADGTIALVEGMKADWLWATKGLEGALSDVRFDAATRRIFVTVAAAGAEGNAVVALTNAEDAVVWSWHLWITDAPATLVYANGCMLMDRALGATGTVPGTAETYGLYYQWGRKDPFFGGTTTETSATAFTLAEAGTVVNPVFAATHAWRQETGSAVSTVGYASGHPMSFLSNKLTTGSYDWLAKPLTDLWGEEKTCYDPCPPGYRVPDRDTWDDLADEQDRYIDGTSEWDAEKYGVTYIWAGATDWYPCAGYRNRDKGNMVGLGTTRTGHYWSNYRAGNNVYLFYISKKLSSGKLLQPQSVKPDAAYGYNVRCCKE